jgi:hypothetical protein
LKHALSKIIRNVSNLPGWSTKRKIIVIESDDWGSIRMPSFEAADRLRKCGIDLGQGESVRYNKYDTLASKGDLEALFNVLSSVKDSFSRHPVFTSVSLVANPDFKKIKESDFKSYYWEPFMETLDSYGLNDAFTTWKKGEEEKLFWPEFHGREHLNVIAWMRALQQKDKNTLSAFKEGCWGFENDHPYNLNYQAAFDLEEQSDILEQKKVIEEGLKLFEKLHGRKARFFVPPNGPFNTQLEEIASIHGIEYMSAAKIQKEPQGEGKTNIKLHYLGQKNRWNQRCITRNCFFEPSDPSKGWIDSCLSEIEIAFKWNKPAVISSHRVNYIGGLQISNREHGLKELNTLLKRIIITWPEVEFMTSTELGDLISKKIVK